jgi:hypothetical protein
MVAADPSRPKPPPPAAAKAASTAAAVNVRRRGRLAVPVLTTHRKPAGAFRTAPMPPA